MKRNVILAFAGAVLGVVVVAVVLLADDPAEGVQTRAVGVVERVGQSEGVERSVSGRNRKPSVERASKKEELLEGYASALQEEGLSVELRQLLDELRVALENEDKGRIITLVRKMQQRDEWPDGIPVSIRSAAIASLGWFGGECIPELAGFLKDPDPELQQSAVEAFEQAMLEANGDVELSEVMIAASQLVTDGDEMDYMLSMLNQVRPSLQVETIKKIWKVGTPEAKRSLVEVVEFITGEEGINTPEALDQWYNDPSGDNQDPEDAEEVYGPVRD